MIKIKISNRALYTLVFLVILILASVVVSSTWSNPDKYHDASTIKVTIGSVDYSEVLGMWKNWTKNYLIKRMKSRRGK